MKYEKHPRYLLGQNLGIKPPCTSNPEQAALILLLKPVLSIFSIRTTFLRHSQNTPGIFRDIQLKPFQINLVLIITMQSSRSDCAIPQFHNHPIYSLQLLNYLGITHTSNPNLHKIPLYPKIFHRQVSFLL